MTAASFPPDGFAKWVKVDEDDPRRFETRPKAIVALESGTHYYVGPKPFEDGRVLAALAVPECEKESPLSGNPCSRPAGHIDGDCRSGGVKHESAEWMAAWLSAAADGTLPGREAVSNGTAMYDEVDPDGVVVNVATQKIHRNIREIARQKATGPGEGRTL